MTFTDFLWGVLAFTVIIGGLWYYIADWTNQVEHGRLIKRIEEGAKNAGVPLGHELNAALAKAEGDVFALRRLQDSLEKYLSACAVDLAKTPYRKSEAEGALERVRKMQAPIEAAQAAARRREEAAAAARQQQEQAQLAVQERARAAEYQRQAATNAARWQQEGERRQQELARQEQERIRQEREDFEHMVKTLEASGEVSVTFEKEVNGVKMRVNAKLDPKKRQQEQKRGEIEQKRQERW